MRLAPAKDYPGTSQSRILVLARLYGENMAADGVMALTLGINGLFLYDSKRQRPEYSPFQGTSSNKNRLLRVYYFQ